MFGGVARADPLDRPQHMTEDLGGRGEGRLGRTALHVSPPTLTGLHLFWHHQQEFTVLSSQVMFEKFPELALASNPLGHLQFGVEVVIGTSHLSNTDPVLPFERQLQWTPAQAGGQIHDEAHDIRESNGTDIPALVPPDSFIAFGLKCRHNDVHIVVPIS